MSSDDGGRDMLWVFACLWLACCPPSAEEAASSFTTGIRLNVPDIILFENGSPTSWLCTHDGRLSRRDLRGQLMSSTPNDIPDNPPTRIPPTDRMRYAVDGLERFWQQNNKGVSSSAGHTCMVWYSDGQHEVLDTSYILKLSTSTTWRKQLMALQGHVAPQSVEFGIYQANEDGSMRDGAARVGLNMLTKAIVKCVMGACTTESNESEISMSRGRQVQPTRLDFMRAVYIVDGQGILWFSHAAETRVRPLLVNIKNKTCASHGGSQALAATQLVSLELGRVLQLAANHGLSTEECFTHFDPHNNGYADADMLRTGLAKLGIGTSAGVADALLLELGGVTAVYFSASDLALFCAHCDVPGSKIRGNTPVRGDRSEGMMELAKETRRSRNERPTIEKSLKTRNDDIEPHTYITRPVTHMGQMSRRKFRPKTSLNSDRATNGIVRGGSELVTRAHQAPRSSWSATSSMGDTVQTPTSPGLQEYLAAPHVRSDEHDNTGKFRWDNLPEWARQTSKSTLIALMDHHKRTLRNVRVEIATPTTPPVTNPLKVLIKLNERVHRGASDGIRHGSSRPRSAQDETGRGCGQRAVTPTGSPSCADKHTECRKGLDREDAKLHIGEGNVMSYRWLSRTVVKPNCGGTVLQATEALNGSRDAMGLHVDQKKEFILIVMPDLFMTLDSLERWLGGVLEKNSRGQLLLIGSLGLPGTQWAEGAVLDSETQARGLSNLLWELLQRGDLCIDPPLCVAMMGLGSGANAVLRFAATQLLDAKFVRLRDAMRFMVLINPFPVTPDTSLERQQVKRSLQTLKNILEVGSHHEKLQALLSSFFSNEYITQHGHTTVLEQFWLQRQELQLSESERPMSAPPSSRIKDRRADTSRDRHDRKRRPTGEGLIQCVNGVLRGATFGTWCNNVNLPLLLICSTRDSLDSSQTAQHFRTSVEAEEVDSLFALVNGNRQSKLLVYRVEAGREILQEAPAQILQILSEAFHAAQMRPLFSPSCGSQHDVSDVGDQNQPQHYQKDAVNSIDQTEELPSSYFVGVGTVNNEKPYLGISNEEISISDASATPKGQNVDSVDSVEGESVYVGNTLDAPVLRVPVDQMKKGRRAREFDVRKERAAERKAKNERLKKQQRLDRLKRTKRKQEQFLEQQRACQVMQQEDSRSRAVDRYIRALEVWSSSVADAKERALELASARDSSEQKAAEDHLAHDHAAQHMHRVELFRQRKLDLLQQDEVDDDELDISRGGNYAEVDFVRDTCGKLLTKLLLLRRRIVEAMQTELLRRDQLTTFETQYSKIASELHEAERLQRTYARGGITADVLGERSLQESADIDQAVAKQQVQLGTYQSVMKERLEMWNMTVSQVQKLKIAIRYKEGELQTTLHSIGENTASQRKKLGHLHAKNENMVTRKASLVSKTEEMRIRVKVLENEMTLLQMHSGQLFDTDIWHVGVVQRISTVKLKQDVQIELITVSRRIKDNVKEMERIDQALEGNTAYGQEIDLNVQKLAQILRTTEQRLNRMVSRTVVQEFQDELGVGQEFHPPGVSKLLTSKKESLASTIRKNPNHRRSMEEKQWVALDILVNAELYQALSVVESEELELNDEYKTELRAEDVTRILESPHEIQLALPHLKTPVEVDAHKLLAKYTHGHGDSEFAEADEQSQDHVFAASPREIRATQPTKEASRTLLSTGPNNHLPERARTAAGVTQIMEHRQDTHNQQAQGSVEEYDAQDAQHPPTDICLHECPPPDLRGHSLDASSCFAIEDTEGCQSSKTDVVKPFLGRQETLQQIILFDTMSDVGVHGPCEDHEAMGVRVGEREVYRSAKRLLKPQESCTHTFRVIDLPPTYSVDLKVTVQFTGCMEARGFSRGKASAILRRNGEYVKGLPASAWESIGFAPHGKQKLNIGDQFYQIPGTIFIQHTPRLVPLVCGEFDVVVTALGLTEYFVVVVAGQSELCASLVDKRITEAKKLQVRLRDLGGEVTDTWEGVRLRERQYHVCNKLIEEARSECARCQEDIDELCEYLRPREIEVVLRPASKSRDDGEESNTESSTSTGTPHSSSKSGSTATDSPSTTSSTTATSSSAPNRQEFSETERAETWNEIAAIELEHMHWGRLFTTRCQEKVSVKKALHQLMKLRREGKAEKTRLKEHLRQISAEIPIVVAAMQGPTVAAERTQELNTNPGFSSAGQPPSIGGAIALATISLVTPAVKTRRTFERGGWEALTLEEQQWVTVDQAMCPQQYLWLQQRQEEEAQLELGQSLHFQAKPGKNPAIDRCRFDRDELLRIMAEPFGDLNRKEAHVRKLLTKFNDQPQLVKSSSAPAHSGRHDILLAQKVRLKKDTHRTATEKEWISLDKILNAQVWKRAKEHVPGTLNDQRPSDAGGSTAPFDKQGWTCPFNRDELLRIWGSDDGTYFATEDEKRAYTLLTTFNGPYQAPSDSAKRGWKGVQMGKVAGNLHVDIDKRLRALQKELDRISHTSNPGINSSVLHVAPQHFPTSSLRLELEAEMDRLLREQVQQRERKNMYLVEDCSSSEEDEDHTHDRKSENRRTRRLSRRASRGNMNVFAARKHMLLDAKKTTLQRETAKRIAELGPGGCPACMSNPCKYTPVVNLKDTNARLECIADELHSARISNDEVLESHVPKSVMRDGITIFRRRELIEELSSEQNNLRYMMKLHFIDMEFHEANRTSKQHIECVALHGYRTFLWTKDARVTLEREHSRLVARMVATEIAGDILEWMLEGWHFGERQSRHNAVGYVPSIKKIGTIKAGIDAKVKDGPSAEQARTSKEEAEDTASAFTIPPGIDGSIWKRTSERVVKPGGIHDEEIGFSEKTMRFGLFCVAIMYFRAQWLLRQQRERASLFKLGWDIDTSVPVQAQRKAIAQTSIISTQAGHQRVKVRKEKEQAEVLADFAGFLAVEKRELDATLLIERIYRGHIGRKAAQRWRAKRAEYNATNSLIVAAAINLQRFMRGCWGRSRAKTVRAGVARWLAHLFDDESREFEAEVLSTNKLEALKRGIGELSVQEEDSQSDT